MYLSNQDKAALILAYREFVREGGDSEEYKEKYEYSGNDHLISLELGHILNSEYAYLLDENLKEIRDSQ